MKKLLISLFDHSGNASEPYISSGKWDVVQVDIKLGQDILTWDYKKYFHTWREKATESIPIGATCEAVTGIICMIPCTDFANSGARHFAEKDIDGRTDLSQNLVAKSKEIIDWFIENSELQFWQIENPMSRIHTLNSWMGSVKFKFNPCDFSGYQNYDNNKLNCLRNINSVDLTNYDEKFIIEDANAYNKMTWLWGKFNNPVIKRVEPVYKENPGWKLYGGKSEKIKELRSVTPMGFCKAFYESNN